MTKQEFEALRMGSRRRAAWKQTAPRTIKGMAGIPKESRRPAVTGTTASRHQNTDEPGGYYIITRRPTE